MLEKFSIRTTSNTEMVDITSQVRSVISKSKIKEGLCVVYVPHTTAAVTINENADPDVVHDIVKELNKVIPFQDGYHHSEGNSAAHIKSSLIGSTVQILIADGSPVFGTWQGIYFCEFDGPRTRNFHVMIK
ncbi:MAG: secondary thiamine-phosphate synthase enzyme YjbQ [bacterium]|nr:secondary thiamine-phosphate synthase enzyme YjbQ [bacterium]